MQNTKGKQILRVLVGSNAHGLATPDSDFDYRGVFVQPTSEILKIGGASEHTQWIEGQVDDTSWELGHFLFLATKCNPTILETFLAPKVDFEWASEFDIAKLTDELRALFPYVWNSKGVATAAIGYGRNQRTKFLDNKDAKPNKFAAAYLRSLYNAWELLSTGTFTIKIIDTPIGETVKRFKEGNYRRGEVIDECEKYEALVKNAEIKYPHEANLEPVNDFLLKVRKAFWL